MHGGLKHMLVVVLMATPILAQAQSKQDRCVKAIMSFFTAGKMLVDTFSFFPRSPVRKIEERVIPIQKQDGECPCEYLILKEPIVTKQTLIIEPISQLLAIFSILSHAVTTILLMRPDNVAFCTPIFPVNSAIVVLQLTLFINKLQLDLQTIGSIIGSLPDFWITYHVFWPHLHL